MNPSQWARGGDEGGDGVMTAARWRIALWAGMLLLVAWVAWQARWALLPFSIGALFAYVLTPVVDRLASLVPGHAQRDNVVLRGFAVVLVYLAIAGVLAGAGVAIVPVAIDEISQFVDDLPTHIDDTQAQVNVWLEVYRERVPEDIRSRIDEYAAQFGDDLGHRIASAGAPVFESLTGWIAVIAGFVVVPIWMFYALRDRHNFERNFAAAVPEPVQPDVLNGVRIADQLIGRYLRGQLLLGFLVGVATFIGLTILGVDLAIALAVFAGVAELIPIVGPFIGALPAVLIVAATDPGKIIPVLLLYVVVQQVENHLLVPRVQGHAVQLHPAVIIMLLAIAGTVFGFIALVVIIPLVALLRELFWYADHRFSGLAPQDAMARTHVAQHFGLDDEDDEPPDDAAAPQGSESGEAEAGVEEEAGV
ncbi:MAG: AI-2E family transporter [Chloroflexi bacterium]|nr:AI-2E family transporter [Chloroflexota bacterium]